MNQGNNMYPYQMHTANMYHVCAQHMNKRVKAELADGKVYEGIIENVDDQNVYLIIEININFTRNEEVEEEEDRAWGYGYPPYYYGYGYPHYGYPYYGYPGYGYGRLILPLAALTALSLL
jgi:small nuclear ribonucleoprotein (snRNP)-like protein